jgi:hypothetical protein
LAWCERRTRKMWSERGVLAADSKDWKYKIGNMKLSLGRVDMNEWLGGRERNVRLP